MVPVPGTMLIPKGGLQGHHLTVCRHGVEGNPDCIPDPPVLLRNLLSPAEVRHGLTKTVNRLIQSVS
jgi:hypothetical protein